MEKIICYYFHEPVSPEECTLRTFRNRDDAEAAFKLIYPDWEEEGHLFDIDDYILTLLESDIE